MVRVISNLFLKIRLITPWVLRAIRMMLFVMVLAASSLWVGIPQAVDKIAGSIVSEAAGKNLPENLDTILYWMACGIAVIEISLSWILLSTITVLLLGIFF